MKKSSQIQSVDASGSAVPERVSVAMGEIAENMGEGLLALAVGAGLQVMAALMEADMAELAGPKGRHDQAADGSGELPVASYEVFSSTEILGKSAMEKMLAGLSTRRYPVGLEPVGQQKDHLPQHLRSSVGRKMTDAYHADSALEAEAALLALAGELDRTHPGVAASLREGLDETLTILRLGVPPTLARTLRSTNCIESMISVCREHASDVKRWHDGRMALRWCAAGMVEAGKQFRRVNGHVHLPALRAALERETAEPVVPVVHNDQVSAA